MAVAVKLKFLATYTVLADILHEFRGPTNRFPMNSRFVGDDLLLASMWEE